jgi:hypothetical protein
VAIWFGLASQEEPHSGGDALGPVIELCRRCGFHVPVGAASCPECGPDGEQVPTLAARQVAGLALPTRSVRRLPRTPPRRDPEPRSVEPAVGARTVFAYTWILVVVALAGALLAWVARLSRYVSALPRGTAEWFDELAVLATLGAVIGLVVGLAAMVVWCIRRIAIEATRRRRDRIVVEGEFRATSSAARRATHRAA